MSETRAALVSALVVTLCGGVSLGLIRIAEAGPVPVARTLVSHPSASRSPTLQIAGSGANVLLMRRMTEGLDVRVHDSIGSGGGVRALHDGAIDVALVSRPLNPEERPGTRVIPYAKTALVWALHGSRRAASAQELTNWYRGRGDPVPLVRELDDSAIRSVRAIAPAIAAAHDQAARARSAELLLNEDAMRRALSQIDGSFGLSDLGQLTLDPVDVQHLSVDGVAPTLENVRTNRYPYVRELALVVREGDARALAFARSMRSDSRTPLLLASGYLPIGRAP